MRPLRLGLACLLALVASREGGATEPPKDWEVELAPYGWLALAHGAVDTQRFGREEFTIDAHDVLSSFDLGAMAAVKARYRRWVAIVDVAWAKLSSKGGLGDTLVRYDVTDKLGWLEALGGYRVYERPGGLFGGANASDERTFGIDALVGITYVWTNLELDLHRNPILPIPPQERHIQVSDHFVAPYLATRFVNDFTERIRHETLLGLGGFGAGEAPNLTWQVTSLLSYRFTDRWLISAGYRALGLRNDDFHVTFHGPILGLGYRF
jgi:opacity protein-like surface antigen